MAEEKPERIKAIEKSLHEGQIMKMEPILAGTRFYGRAEAEFCNSMEKQKDPKRREQMQRRYEELAKKLRDLSVETRERTLRNEIKKWEAADFLTGLKTHLNNKLPLQKVKDWIQEKGKVANEGLFLEELVLPAIPEYLRENLDLDPPAADIRDERIRTVFLTESTYMRGLGLASKSPASAKKYLFTKVGVNPKQIVNLWWDKGCKKGQTTQSCPDWAFGEPCPHTVVFEGKLFRGRYSGRTELVNGIYQCFYYRAHPETPEDGTHPAWNYDYACLFVYDVSENQSLVTAWSDLNEDVKDACWESANLFIIVLPAAKDTGAVVSS